MMNFSTVSLSYVLRSDQNTFGWGLSYRNFVFKPQLNHKKEILTFCSNPCQRILNIRKFLQRFYWVAVLSKRFLENSHDQYGDVDPAAWLEKDSNMCDMQNINRFT